NTTVRIIGTRWLATTAGRTTCWAPAMTCCGSPRPTFPKHPTRWSPGCATPCQSPAKRAFEGGCTLPTPPDARIRGRTHPTLALCAGGDKSVGVVAWVWWEGYAPAL